LRSSITVKNYNQVNVLKLVARNKGVIIKTNQFTVSKSGRGDTTFIVPIFTNKPCNITFGG